MNATNNNAKPVDVLAVIDSVTMSMDDAQGDELRDARDAVAELLQDAAPLVASLKQRIDADNAMTPQAVMVRRMAAALARCGVQ